jgi:flagellar biosynthesis chaperone FliJ
MKKNMTFSLLEKIQQTQLRKIILNIKILHDKRMHDTKQLQVLNNYEKEYIKKIYKEIVFGMCMHKWIHYNDFVIVLRKIIQDNEIFLKKNDNMIENSILNWCNHENQRKIWHILNIKNKKKILKSKKIQARVLNDNDIQLKLLKKG